MSNERKLDDRISEVANKTLQREQLLEQRIKNLERKLELKEVKDRLTLMLHPFQVVNNSVLS